MKKRLFAAVTAAMCLTGMLAALPASALTEDEVSSLTITTDTFTYSPNVDRFGRMCGMNLDTDLVDADFMVVGYHHYKGDPNEKIIGYFVSSINDDRDIGTLWGGSADRKLEVGDLLAVNNGMLVATDSYPPEYSCNDDDDNYTNLTLTYVGNGVTIFGDAFRDVIRTHLKAEQDGFDERKRVSGALYDIELLNTGDMDLDGALSIADCVLLDRYVLGDAASGGYADLSGDLNEDGVVDVFDLALLKHKLLSL